MYVFVTIKSMLPRMKSLLSKLLLRTGWQHKWSTNSWACLHWVYSIVQLGPFHQPESTNAWLITLNWKNEDIQHDLWHDYEKIQLLPQTHWWKSNSYLKLTEGSRLYSDRFHVICDLSSNGGCVDRGFIQMEVSFWLCSNVLLEVLFQNGVPTYWDVPFWNAHRAHHAQHECAWGLAAQITENCQ